jgi:cytochrome c-type biogenesis protein CcsB
MPISLQSFFSQCCFFSIVGTTLYYWIRNISFLESGRQWYGLFGMTVTNVFLVSQLVSRWILSGHFPLSNLYESLVFLAWCLVTLYSILEYWTRSDFFGIFISPVVLGLIGFTQFSLSSDLQAVKPLVPALQSNWLIMHVSVMIASYAALIFGCLLAMSYLLFTFWFTEKTENTENPAQATTLLEVLDNWSYRMISIGFCFLTLGILSGAIWANETWGSYWSWDPKETWAFITWVTFAVYLHSRLLPYIPNKAQYVTQSDGQSQSQRQSESKTRSSRVDGIGRVDSVSAILQGTKQRTVFSVTTEPKTYSAWIASFGFLVIWVCYLGVNLVGKGLHSYGFFS